jgi:hypothetical protein
MSTAKERAEARASWPVKRVSLDAAEPPALSASSGWHEVLELTWEAFSLAGEIPAALPRAQWPARLFRRGEQRPDSHGL